MRRVHVLLSGLSLMIVALSVNRLSGVTQQRVDPDGFLRWLDLNAMLPIPIVSIVLYYLLKRDVEHAGEAVRSRRVTILNVAFVVGVYLFGVSSGDHETTNYLHQRFCTDQPPDPNFCAVVIFHDDTFSHVIYYAGVILYTLALVLIERSFPRRSAVSRRDRLGIGLNAAVIAVGIFANLAFEETGLDLAVFALVAVVSNAVLWLSGRHWVRLPVTLYVAGSFGTGLIATLLYKLLA